MQTPDLFLGLTATGWTAIGSIAGALSILTLCIYNYAYLSAALRGIEVQLKSMEFQVDGIIYSYCPVLTIRKDQKGNDVLHNCGQGPALMVQWGYGQSPLEASVSKRQDDNIIPAGDSQPIAVDWELARSSGLILFAYSVTNDKFVTTIKWPAGGGERYVHFGPYEGELPLPPGLQHS